MPPYPSLTDSRSAILGLLEQLVRGEKEDEEEEEDWVLRECLEEVMQEMIQDVGETGEKEEKEGQEEQRKMKKKVKELTSKMMSKSVRDLIHYSVKWVAWEQGPDFYCSYLPCRARLTDPRLRCAQCAKCQQKAGPKPSSSQVAFYCGEECAELDWNARHSQFHAVGRS